MPHMSAATAIMMHPRPKHNGIPRVKLPSLRLPKPDSPDLIMSLPPELRNAIYDLALCYAHGAPTIHINIRTGKLGNNKTKHSLLGTSKQIRAEASSAYYGTNSFVVHIKPFTVAQVQQVADWLRTIIATCGPNPFGSLKLRIHGSVWQDPYAIMPLLQLMRETGFWPYSEADSLQYRQAIESQIRGRLMDAAKCSMFIMQSEDYVHVQRMLEGAVSLARRAHVAALGLETLRLSVEALIRNETAHGRGRAALRQRERRVKEYRRRSVAEDAAVVP